MGLDCSDCLYHLGVSAFVVFILHKLRVPSIVGSLIAGVFLGPHGFGFIQDIREVELVAESESFSSSLPLASKSL